MSDMLMEVDEAVRAQQMRALWSRYGQWFIGFLVLAVLATAIGVFWRSRVNAAFTQQSGQLLGILQNEAEDKDTVQKLGALSKNADVPFKAVVQLYQAQKLEQGKKLDEAQKAYGAVYNERNVPAITQNLARVHYVRLGLLLNQKPANLLPVLDKVTQGPQAAFRFSALELKGLLLLQQNKQKEANTIFTDLSNDSDVPGTLRARAKSMIHYEDQNAQ